MKNRFEVGEQAILVDLPAGLGDRHRLLGSRVMIVKHWSEPEEYLQFYSIKVDGLIRLYGCAHDRLKPIGKSYKITITRKDGEP